MNDANEREDVKWIPCLGVEAMDRVTLIRGFITARVHYLTGAPRCGLEYATREGKVETVYFDEARLVEPGSLPNREAS